MKQVCYISLIGDVITETILQGCYGRFTSWRVSRFIDEVPFLSNGFQVCKDV